MLPKRRKTAVCALREATIATSGGAEYDVMILLNSTTASESTYI
jgi:hypothetical protein